MRKKNIKSTSKESFNIGSLREKSMENMFTIVEKDNLVLFRLFQYIYSNNFLIAIILSESAYTMINILFGKLTLEDK